MDVVFSVAFFAAVVRLTAPIAIAALGEVVAERSGVFNVGIEGMMLMGAFGGVWGAQIFGATFAGVLFGMLLALALGLIVAVLVINIGLDQIVVGIVITIFALGVTSYLNGVVISSSDVHDYQLTRLAIPLLSDIPFFGSVLFNQNPVVYCGYVLMAAVPWWLYRTHDGLVLRATGERSEAVAFEGHRVRWTRYKALCFGALTAGLGGTMISLATGGIFIDAMTAGRGWIALIAVVLGRWRPLLSVGACALFGLAGALQFRLQANNPDLPVELFFALPYVVTLVFLFSLKGKSGEPAELGQPYTAR